MRSKPIAGRRALLADCADEMQQLARLPARALSGIPITGLSA